MGNDTRGTPDVTGGEADGKTARPPESSDPVKIASLRDLSTQLELLRKEMRARHVEARDTFESVHPAHRRDAQNLVDYLTLRRHDIRPLQAALAELGLSSLGRAEEHVLSTLERVLSIIQALAGTGKGPLTEAAVDYHEGERSLESNTTDLLGPAPRRRPTRILVTMPNEAALDERLVGDLIDRGMNCARINCAHDGPETWSRMVDNLRNAAAKAGRTCPIFMDLPGPKLRTGPIEPGPRVVRLRPVRDLRGRAMVPATALLAPDACRGVVGTSDGAAVQLPVSSGWLSRVHVGDEISLQDARGAVRALRVTDDDGPTRSVEVWDTTYIESGTRLVAADGTDVVVGVLPSVEQALRLRPRDLLTLTVDLTPVFPGGIEQKDATRAFRIGCTLPEALLALQEGDRVWLDDGKIGGVVVDVRPDEADIEIVTASSTGTKLRAERGINLPDSGLRLPAIGPEDEAVLPFIVDHADAVELSFVQRIADILTLRQRLDQLGGSHLGIVLKIETVQGFNRLPELLLAAMSAERVGVMVARGDLAVESGFERLAEVQDEILCLCAAAHLPVIWATQVLDQMARTGMPSRAEISDAALAGRAECVMLNKGPHIREAVTGLDDILTRMSGHQHKKVALLRRLSSWSPERD